MYFVRSAIWLFCLLPAVSAANFALIPATPATKLVAPAANLAYTGFWLTESQDAVVEIARQGEGYAGRYVAFRKTGATPKGKALLHTLLLKDLKPDSDELSGKVIDPGSGKDYKVTLTMTSDKILEMRVKAMGMTAHKETWTRQPTAN